MTTRLVRSLRPADRVPLQEALTACPEFDEREVEVAVELIDTELAGKGDYVHLVIEHDGAVGGYVCISTIPLTHHAWNLYWICVHPRLQGHGLGRLLLRAAEAHAGTHGGQLLVLETSGRAAYDPTRRFYEACGWAEEARIRDFYRPGDDVVYYVKRL